MGSAVLAPRAQTSSFLRSWARGAGGQLQGILLSKDIAPWLSRLPSASFFCSLACLPGQIAAGDVSLRRLVVLPWRLLRHGPGPFSLAGAWTDEVKRPVA